MSKRCSRRRAGNRKARQSQTPQQPVLHQSNPQSPPPAATSVQDTRNVSVRCMYCAFLIEFELALPSCGFRKWQINYQEFCHSCDEYHSTALGGIHEEIAFCRTQEQKLLGHMMTARSEISKNIIILQSAKLQLRRLEMEASVLDGVTKDENARARRQAIMNMQRADLLSMVSTFSYQTGCDATMDYRI